MIKMHHEIYYILRSGLRDPTPQSLCMHYLMHVHVYRVTPFYNRTQFHCDHIPMNLTGMLPFLLQQNTQNYLMLSEKIVYFAAFA